MRILSIETSCDDTSIAIVEATGKASKTAAPRFVVRANIISSQTATHRHWGGVVPNLAKREHIKNLPKIYKTLTAERSTLSPDLIAVTVGPGLEPSLWAGIEFAKILATKLKIPLVGANHLEGHLYSFLLPPLTPVILSGTKNPTRSLPAGRQASGHNPQDDIRTPITFPAVALLVSGGHTMLLHMKDLLHWKLLGETRDDAVGEAFDKVARMMNLPYPGGPEIEKLAKKGNSKAIAFPRPMMREDNYDFSFSGLKTAVLYYLRNHAVSSSRGGTTKQSDAERHPEPAGEGSHGIASADGHRLRNDSANISASFQAAAIDVLVTKTIRAVREFGAQSVILCGGVAANTALRETLARAAGIAGATFVAPAKEYNTDNAAMIAAAAYINTFRKKKTRPELAEGYPMEANGNLGM